MAKKKNRHRTGQETKAGFVSTEFEISGYSRLRRRRAALRESRRFTTSKFAAPAAAAPQAETLNDVLEKYDIRRCARTSDFRYRRSKRGSRSPPRCRQSRTRRSSRRRAWTRSSLRAASSRSCRRKSSDAAKIARELNQKGPVWKAYVAPRPVPAAVLNGSQAGSRNFEPSQGYLHAAPNGIGAIEVWGLGRREGRGHHDLRHRRQLEPQARRSALRHPADRRHADRRSRLEESRHGGARRDDLHPRRQGHGRHQPRGQGRRPLRRHQRRVQRCRRDHQRGERRSKPAT